jgi:hypothetical protein
MAELCEETTKACEPCSSGRLAGLTTCLPHASAKVKAAYGFGGPQAGSGRPPSRASVSWSQRSPSSTRTS